MNLRSIWILRRIHSHNDTDSEQMTLKNYTVSFVSGSKDSPPGGWKERSGLDLMKIPACHVILWCFFVVDVVGAAPTGDTPTTSE